MVEALALLRKSPASENSVQELSLRELKVGMTFAEDVKSSTGLLLISRGQEVTAGLLERLSNFAQHFGTAKPVKVILPKAPAQNGR